MRSNFEVVSNRLSSIAQSEDKDTFTLSFSRAEIEALLATKDQMDLQNAAKENEAGDEAAD